MKYTNIDLTKSLEGEQLLRELNEYRTQGCSLKLNGRPSRPEQITKACLREHHTYMRDIVSDDSENSIREINFVRLRSI